MSIDRRSLLKIAGIAAAIPGGPLLAQTVEHGPTEKADYTLRIATGLVDLGDKHIVSTTLYNGQFPGPLVRLKEGERVVVEVRNDTDTPELRHWHGQMIPNQTFEVTIVKHNGADNGFNQWLLNGEAFSMQTKKPAYAVHQGGRYRFKFRNASDDIHPLHLHRHGFELVRVGGKPTAGVIKDVVMLGGFQEVEFDFVADNPGPTLFHCHQQLHMDYGFMAMVNYA